MNRVLATLGALLIAALPAVAHGQRVASPTTVMLMGGAALPMGDLDDLGNTGFTIGGGVEFGASVLPFGVRAELGYTRFGQEDQTVPDGEGGTITVKARPSNLAVTLNAILAPAPSATSPATVRPYAIAGVGFYNAKVDASIAGGGFDFGGSDTKGGFGLNGGAGVRFQFVGFSSFIEARYHHLFKGMPDVESDDESWTSAGYVPITFGFTIGG
jgi:opacity protein-like surface antigen